MLLELKDPRHAPVCKTLLVADHDHSGVFLSIYFIRSYAVSVFNFYRVQYYHYCIRIRMHDSSSDNNYYRSIVLVLCDDVAY